MARVRDIEPGELPSDLAEIYERFGHHLRKALPGFAEKVTRYYA